MRGAIAIRTRTGGPLNRPRWPQRFVRARLQSCRKRLTLLPALAAERTSFPLSFRPFLPPPPATLHPNSKISNRESLQSQIHPPRSNRENHAPVDTAINPSPNRPHQKTSNRESIRWTNPVEGEHPPFHNVRPSRRRRAIRVGAAVNLPPALALGVLPNALQPKNPAPIRTKRKKHPSKFVSVRKNLPFVFFNLRKI
jgi:hypothetical protein